jgi:GNAT superfamily N-acetyltransferase
MRVTVHTLAERPELARHNRRLHVRGAWPRFLEDTALNPLFDEVVRGREFAEFQLGLWDARGRVVAVGDTVPFRWDGTTGDLPHRIADVVARGIDGRHKGHAPNAMSALAAVVDPRLRGKGLSTRVIQEMGRIAHAPRVPCPGRAGAPHPQGDAIRWCRWRNTCAGARRAAAPSILGCACTGGWARAW